MITVSKLTPDVIEVQYHSTKPHHEISEDELGIPAIADSTRTLVSYSYYNIHTNIQYDNKSNIYNRLTLMELQTRQQLKINSDEIEKIQNMFLRIYERQIYQHKQYSINSQEFKTWTANKKAMEAEFVQRLDMFWNTLHYFDK